MNYNWPIIRTINDILPTIKYRDEFIVAEREWGTVINYQVNYIDTFPRANTKDDALNLHYVLRRECRGIKFGLDGNILARPFHKFFNLNERSETADTNIDWNNPFKILQKLDGSMIHPILVDDTIFWCTKMGITDVADQAKSFAAKNAKYENFARDMIAKGITPLLEWCSRDQRIILDYSEDNLVLLALRNMITGEYINYNIMVNTALQYDIPIVDAFDGTFNGIAEFLEDVTDRENEEGYVLRFDTGHAVKVKNLWYCQLHKTKELLNFEKDVVGLVLRNTHDDAKSFMDQDNIDRLDKFADDLISNIKSTASELEWIVIEIRDNVGESQKKFAAGVMSNHNNVSGLLFNIDNGKDPYDTVIELILKNLGSSTRVDSVRHLFGDIYWRDY